MSHQGPGKVASLSRRSPVTHGRLLIRRSLVRAQVGEPKVPSDQALALQSAGAFSFFARSRAYGHAALASVRKADISAVAQDLWDRSLAAKSETLALLLTAPQSTSALPNPKAPTAIRSPVYREVLTKRKQLAPKPLARDAIEPLPSVRALGIGASAARGWASEDRPSNQGRQSFTSTSNLSRVSRTGLLPVSAATSSPPGWVDLVT